MEVDKAKLMATSVIKLKIIAKKSQVKLDDPKTGKAKTKLQLVNSIIMKHRLTGKSNIAKDSKLKAKLPGKRKSASGKVYYERRANRADRSAKFMLGGKKPTATDIKAKEFKMHLTQLNKVANEIIKARGTNQIPELRKQLSGEMRSCKSCYSAFLLKAK
jgi:hypothetical protein